MVIFYIGAGIGLVLAAVYLFVGALSFLRIRRELLSGGDLGQGAEPEEASSGVALVPGFGWKASLAVLTSFVALIVASYTGVFWYVLALSGLGTAAAVIVAFVLELRNDRAPA
ncbi:hypothetical protein [Mycobacterium sp. MMS18-G62]